MTVCVSAESTFFLNCSDIDIFNLDRQTSCMKFCLNFGYALCTRPVCSLKTCDVTSCEAILAMSACDERRVWCPD